MSDRGQMYRGENCSTNYGTFSRLWHCPAGYTVSCSPFCADLSETARGSHVTEHRQDVDPIIGDAVGSQLKSLFDEFAKEAVPDRFTKLIEQLEQVEAAEKKAAEEGGDK